ncbi:hypothetical protein ABZ896_43385 [Streptomyces sp. NPDC047072]|uniref:hypothetical protein n=1 Tax=Streptomyces sp. NPDC047072 TaxID=3154809 RepID=UPI0034087814
MSTRPKSSVLGGPRQAVLAAAALAAVTVLATAAPALAQPAATPQQGRVYAWISDGWGGGTVTSTPAGINCHTTAWDPYAEGAEAPYPTGTCDASFPVGTTVTFTATPDPGSYLNGDPYPTSLRVSPGYNPVWVMFCPQDGLCSSW